MTTVARFLKIGSLSALLPGMITAQSAAVPDSLGTERVDGPTGALIDAQMTLYASQGFSGTLLVVRDQRVVLLKGYGRATDTDSTRNAPDTRFEMNSMTKMFTGVSVLQLAGDGRLSLDDSVERHLGAFAVAKPEATIRHLGLHTAGLVPAGTSLASESREAFLRDVGKAPRESAAGVAYRYTNAGFSVLAAIVESVSGESFESYVRRRIFTPAGMRTALFRDEVPASDSRFARGYVAGPSHRVPGPANPYGWGTIGAGGVWCTVGDVYRWLLFVESGRAFDARFRSLLFTDPPAPAQEAFGWRYTAGSDSSRALIAKGGGSDDFASQLLYFPKERVVIVWASNDLSKRWRRTLNQAVPDLVFNGRTSARPPS